jgi:hypothetical protein
VLFFFFLSKKHVFIAFEDVVGCDLCLNVLYLSKKTTKHLNQTPSKKNSRENKEHTKRTERKPELGKTYKERPKNKNSGEEKTRAKKKKT